jgi:cytochrome c-type biogenesis protein CcmH/NrfF
MHAGEAQEQIIAEYAAEFGQDAVSIPPNRGVLKAIYLVPVLGIALGAAGLAGMMRRWRRGPGRKDLPDDNRPSDNRGDRPPAAPGDGYDARLDDELKDLDG